MRMPVAPQAPSSMTTKLPMMPSAGFGPSLTKTPWAMPRASLAVVGDEAAKAVLTGRSGHGATEVMAVEAGDVELPVAGREVPRHVEVAGRGVGVAGGEDVGRDGADRRALEGRGRGPKLRQLIELGRRRDIARRPLAFDVERDADAAVVDAARALQRPQSRKVQAQYWTLLGSVASSWLTISLVTGNGRSDLPDRAAEESRRVGIGVEGHRAAQRSRRSSPG